MFRNRSLALKLIFFFSVSTISIFSMVLAYNYRSSREIIQKNQEEEVRNLVLFKGSQIEAVLSGVQKVTQGLADHLEHSSCSKAEISALIKSTLEHNPEIYGSTIAFEPYGYDSQTPTFAPYYYRKGGGMAFADLAKESYAYRQWDWYLTPKKRQSAQWSAPYYDEGGGNIFMSTYSVPLYRTIGKERRFLGVVTADVSLEWLREIVSSIKILRTGYGFLISRKGHFITHPAKELVMNQTLFGVAKARGDKGLEEIAGKMIQGQSGAVFIQDLISARKCWMTYTPIPSTGWSLAVLFPKDELMADINRLYRHMIIMAFIGLLLFSGAVILIARTITRPLRSMAKATGEIAKGNLDEALPTVKSLDEVGQMAAGFAAMQTSLKAYIQKLTETTAAKERMESELNIAREIQMSILPKIFPPFPDHPEFDLFAFIEPAREVGGDFYDFFQIDPAHLCFVIADVSGKGVPASLFMAVTKTLVKATAREGITPADILTQVNQELASDNETSMFVTIFCGILNIDNGEVLYANAGHNPPLLVRKGGEVSCLENSGGLVMGAMEGVCYQGERLVLEPGESLFLYTDGVTEAMNAKEEMFSEERLQKELASLHQESIEALVKGVMGKITDFSEGFPQSDDITMMVLRYQGKK